MRDLLLRLTHDTVIRGSTACDAPDVDPVFSVYDFLDVVARPPTHKRKRGAFSRDVWARLTSPQSPFCAELRALAVDAPIRASVKVRRSTPTPAMTVSALQTLLRAVVVNLNSSLSNTDPHVRHTVTNTLARFVAGDHSMLHKIEVRLDKASSVNHTLERDDDVVDSQIHVKKTKHTSTDNTDTPDLLLHLIKDTVVRGTITPDGSAQVFSVYDFIDVVGNQLSKQKKCSKYSRDFWKRLTHRNFPYRSSFAYTFVNASIRCNMQCQRRTTTPAMTVLDLQRVLEFVYSESHKLDGQGLRQKTRRYPMDYETRNSLEEIFEKYKKGDHTMIENRN
jgi:hypothetical protein